MIEEDVMFYMDCYFGVGEQIWERIEWMHLPVILTESNSEFLVNMGEFSNMIVI